MGHVNIEIKASCSNHRKIQRILQQHHADFKGTDHQVDTYFQVPRGRLKLREGNIENFLVFYQRDDQEGPKQSNVILYKTSPGSSLRDILVQSHDILAVVDKLREIYCIENVKFHLDTVQELGTFVEIEAIDSDGTLGHEKLLAQCNYYLKLFQIPEQDLLSHSYSDMLMDKKTIV